MKYIYAESEVIGRMPRELAQIFDEDLRGYKESDLKNSDPMWSFVVICFTGIIDPPSYEHWDRCEKRLSRIFDPHLHQQGCERVLECYQARRFETDPLRWKDVLPYEWITSWRNVAFAHASSHLAGLRKGMEIAMGSRELQPFLAEKVTAVLHGNRPSVLHNRVWLTVDMGNQLGAWADGVVAFTNYLLALYQDHPTVRSFSDDDILRMIEGISPVNTGQYPYSLLMPDEPLVRAHNTSRVSMKV